MKYVLFSYLILFSSSLIANEEIYITIENHIKSELSEIDREGFELESSKLADLDGDKKEEIVFVWTILGPTYWKNYLTVLKIQKNKYVHCATLGLTGHASLESIKNNKIYLSQTIYAPKDPICCPTIEKKIAYIFKNDNINREK